MKIRGDRPHASIGKFDEIELPALTVIVGINGSGKSQFLQAIETGAIATDLLGQTYSDVGQPNAAHHGQILRIEHGVSVPTMLDTLAQSNLTIPAPHPTHPPMPHIVGPAQFDSTRSRLLRDVRDKLESLVGEEILTSIEKRDDIWRLGIIEFAEQANFQSDTSAIRKIFEDAENCLISPQPLERPSARLADPALHSFWSSVRGISNRLGISPLEVDSTHLTDFNQWGSFTAFDPNISQMFGSYRDAYVRNDLKVVSDKRNGTNDALSDDDFRLKYGRPPWEALSEIIQSFGLNYRVSEPPNEPTQAFGFLLKRLDTNVPVGFSGLSSGEKVLLRFALSLFPYDPLRLGVTMPRLLLLDEMDASLHPEMLHRWLGAISDGLVKGQGMHCILTTHSPTTVALAPDESLFELVAGDSRPREITKQKALNKLTVGLPTLAFDYAGRRQVFVESSVDANQYEKINSLLKSKLDLPRSITFISAGASAGGDARGGCTVVKQLVGSLIAAGVKSLYGIVDWDGENSPSAHVKVMGHNTHYTKENILLDPLLVGILLMMERPKDVEFPLKLSDIDSTDKIKLQILSNMVSDKLSLSADLSSNHYIDGLELEVPAEYNSMKGHDLEQLLVQSFPSLNRYSGSGKWLVDQIIDMVLSNYPQFCPLPIATMFRSIAEEEAH